MSETANTYRVKDLAYYRKLLDIAKESKRIWLDDLEKNPDYIHIGEEINLYSQQVKDLEDEIRESAELSGDKHPHPAVEVKEYYVAEIVDETKLREWCLSNFTPALSLDRKAVEKAAIAGTIPNALVDVTKKPKAFIARDLSEYLD